LRYMPEDSIVVALSTPLDLTHFGFTQTENIVYSRLLEAGPSGGYAVAREVNLARANVYQALRGLAVKGAAVATGENPQKFRAIRPADLYALILEQESQKIDRLGAQIAHVPERGADAFIPITSERAFLGLAERAVVREPGKVDVVAPGRILSSLLPALRKRVADGGLTEIWLLGDPVEFPVTIRGMIPAERAILIFRSLAALVLLEQGALAARVEQGSLSGYWTSEPTVLGATRACFLALTSST